ncbi:unnamed protein product [Protopolystoma xenopodis]|uniref:Uncharacterized protein n=1 Tax=Protopolystoma xenopodis TaxID=117903 RepID=A0A3S5BB79_9PLAT|nr:unnamed protein product [Protopolystoma xenopodis]
MATDKNTSELDELHSGPTSSGADLTIFQTYRVMWGVIRLPPILSYIGLLFAIKVKNKFKVLKLAIFYNNQNDLL